MTSHFNISGYSNSFFKHEMLYSSERKIKNKLKNVQKFYGMRVTM